MIQEEAKDYFMTVIITDVHYRMALAAIRDAGEIKAEIIACETKQFQKTALGFLSKYVSETVVLSNYAYADDLYILCQKTLQEKKEKPVLLCIGAKTQLKIAQQSERFAEVADFLIPTPEQIDLFNNKAEVSKLAKRFGIAVPVGYCKNADETLEHFAARIPLPCVIKPICGEQFGLRVSERYRIVKSQTALKQAYMHFLNLTDSAPIVQEYLNGQSVGCSVLAKNGKILAHICHERIREFPISGGPSSCCRVIYDETLLSDVATLVQSTNYSGIAMFEFKASSEKKWHLLEVNPRIWGTFPLTRIAGSNFTELWIKAAQGRELPQYRIPRLQKMVFYPSDIAAALGYLRAGRLKMFFCAVADWFRPSVLSGLHDRRDPSPSRLYWENILLKGKKET